MPARLVGHAEFVDGVMRPVYKDDRGQFVVDDAGEIIEGTWIINRAELEAYFASLPLIVDANTPKSGDPF